MGSASLSFSVQQRVGGGEGIDASAPEDGEEGVDASIMGDDTGVEGTKALI